MIGATEVSNALYSLQRQWRQVQLRYQAEERIHPHRFNPFKYLRADEYGLSSVIAGVLDPAGEHGQGAELLNAFLNVFDIDVDRLNNATVAVESPTYSLGSDRRIDIVVHTPRWVVGIENKPWAGDQDSQVRDYLNELELRARGGKYFLIYLTALDGQRPSENSISAADYEDALTRGTLKLRSYRTHIARWLNDCVELCEPLAVKQFLAFFRDFLEGAVPGRLSQLENRMIVDAIFEPKNEPHLPVVIELIEGAGSMG